MKKEQPLSTQKKQKAAIYIRVSTEEQAKTGFSLEAQKEALKNYCSALGYEIFKVYEDGGKSAKDMHRPALQELLKDSSEKKFDAIFIYKLDRFSRSLKDLILTIEKLKEWNIDFISLQDKIETASASGKLMFHILSAFAEFERDIISERTKFGMEERAKEGGTVTKAPLGYIILNKELKVDEEKAEAVKNIFNTFLNTQTSLSQLAKQQGMTTRGLIKLLKNRTYIGEVKFKKDYKGRHEAIMSAELFEKSQEKLKKIQQNKKFRKTSNFLFHLLIQGDYRYLDNYNLEILANFIMNEAILFEEKSIPEIKEPEKEQLERILGPQKNEKHIAKIMLENEGFSDSEILYEASFLGSKPDVLAEKQEKRIVVECGPCRINKIISYLSEENTFVWALYSGYPPWDKNPLQGVQKARLFEFRRGKNWQQQVEEHAKRIEEELKKIESPLDTLMKERENEKKGDEQAQNTELIKDQKH